MSFRIRNLLAGAVIASLLLSGCSSDGGQPTARLEDAGSVNSLSSLFACGVQGLLKTKCGLFAPVVELVPATAIETEVVLTVNSSCVTSNSNSSLLIEDGAVNKHAVLY